MKAIKIQKSPDHAIQDVLKYLFESNKIDGVFSLIKKGNGKHVYSLITKKELLSEITPTFPLMPVNAGKMVSQLTVLEPVKKPIAVVLRPCELRALYELVKVEQAKLDNLLFISFTCGGVFSLKLKKDELTQEIKEYWDNTKTGEPVKGLREACTMCTEFVPYNADIIIPILGKNVSQQTSFIMNTEKGVKYLSGMSGEYSEENIGSNEIEAIRKKRAGRKKAVFMNLKLKDLGWNNMINVFGRCINCYACSSVCPVCYCVLCYIRSGEKDKLPLSWQKRLNKNGFLRIPDDTVMYHLVRLLHVGIMCVGCGMCSDVCPTDIPIASIFTTVGGHMQKTLEYQPGKDLEEPMPLAVVNPEDFAAAPAETE
ncbi:MAG: coenzyme F420 hydrogenase [bacterium]